MIYFEGGILTWIQTLEAKKSKMSQGGGRREMKYTLAFHAEGKKLRLSEIDPDNISK